MDIVTKYNVYDRGVLLFSYDNQAPATAAAKRASLPRYGSPGRSLTVVEETYVIASTRAVRDVIDGKVTKCS